MLPIVPYQNKVEITGLTKDNAYHTVDITAFLANPGAVGILLEYHNTHAVQWKQGGYKTTGSVADRHDNVEPTSHCIFVAKLINNQFDYKVTDSNVKAYILAEYHSPAVVLHNSDAWVLKQGVGNTWSDHTLNLVGSDTVADVECALLGIYKNNGAVTVGVRCKGATGEQISVCGSRTGCFPLCTIPPKIDLNGQYQHYFGQGFCDLPTCWVVEMGYIKKGNYIAIEDPAEESVPTNIDYEDYDISTIVKKYTVGTYMSARNTGGFSSNAPSGIREESSSNPTDNNNGTKYPAYFVGVDNSREIEVRYESGYNVVFQIWGYLTDLVYGENTLIIDTGELNINTGELNIG